MRGNGVGWLAPVMGLVWHACLAGPALSQENRQTDLPAASAPVQVREALDGAGPSHIVAFDATRLAVIDPLDASIRLIDPATGRREGACRFPRDFRPWRLVRWPDRILVHEELAHGAAQPARTLEIPRDLARFAAPSCRLQARAFDARSDAGPPAMRRDGGTTIALALPPEGRRPGPVLEVAATDGMTLLGARLLSPAADGYRYVLWKQERAGTPGRIAVDVLIGRYDAEGRLHAAARIDTARFAKRAFDYVDVMPDGRVVVLSSRRGAGGNAPFTLRSYRFPARDPQSPLVTALVRVNRDGGDLVLESSADGLIRPEWEAAEPGGRAMELFARAGGLKCLSRGEMQARAEAFLIEVGDWTYAPGVRDVPCGTADQCRVKLSGTGFVTGTGLWVRPSHLREIPPGTRMTGVLYSFGGTDDVASFRRKLAEGLPAGNIGLKIPAVSAGSCDRDRYPAGIDCSALLGRIWGIPVGCQPNRAFTTNDVNAVSTRVPAWRDLRTGDAINLRGVHVVMVVDRVTIDGATEALRVIEASSRCGKVCQSIYELDQFEGWDMRRRKEIAGETCPAD